MYTRSCRQLQLLMNSKACQALSALQPRQLLNWPVVTVDPGTCCNTGILQALPGRAVRVALVCCKSSMLLRVPAAAS